ncbi:hypothetical protein BDZ89DRAFT_1161644 [Hymenopellis radicata]|nr:hypothetical protein BDZ89DRAFT_1161644 [Hymenopellis radicata]
MPFQSDTTVTKRKDGVSSIVEHLSAPSLILCDSPSSSLRPPKQEPIAIVGMAVNMPGAPNVSKLWEVLEQGINTISEVPESRFNVSAYTEGSRKMKAHSGNFIDNADEFDNKFFKISPREAKSMDPRQRILLHTAYEALEDAGYVPNATESFNPDTFGCYIGATGNDYVHNLRKDIDVYYVTGNVNAFLSGRLSYVFQLGGPCLVIDTACSSSAVAVYQGARALMNRDCNAALVGGVNMFLGLDRGHFLSPTGQCKSFDESADCYSRSEGCGLFVMKRLSDALAEQDHIWGVIRAVDVNHNALATSITHPHVPTQIKLLQTVLENAAIHPGRVNVVEAHGTGTRAGDPTELESLRAVFLSGGENRDLHVTSIKANIGHLEPASGAAGLAKILLMFRHRTIPRCISLHTLNADIQPGDGLVIDKVATPWNPTGAGLTLMAVLNNFGATGSNTAALVEEHVPDVSDHAARCLVLGISAKTEEALDRLKERYIEWMQSSACTESWSDIAYTATARRQLYPWRTAISASKKEEAVTKLKTSKLVDTSALQADPKVVFVFSGQGSQYVGMGQALYHTSPLFHSIVDQCHNLLISAGFVGVLAIISPDGVGSSLSKTDEFEAYQAAIFVLEYALARLWMSWGLKPSAVVGHSLGEYAALVLADVLSLEGALLLVANRVRIMVTKCATKSTGMIAVNLSSSSIASHIASFEDLSVACFNSPTDCVVSGPLISLSKFKQYLDVNNVGKNIMLSVPFGYHSSAMHPVVADLTHVANLVAIRTPTIPIVSNVLGETVRPGDASAFHAEYFSEHCLQPVQFQRGIESLLRSGNVDIWLEIGPDAPCLPMIKSILGNHSSLLLPSLRKRNDPWDNVDKQPCFALPIARRCELAKHFWVPFVEEIIPDLVTLGKPYITLSDYVMLDRWIQRPTAANAFTSIFETPLAHLDKFISGHRVGGSCLCPASVYLEQVLAGIATSWTVANDQHAVIRKLTISSPLVYDPAVPCVITTSLTLDGDVGTFTVSTFRDDASKIMHAHGDFKLESLAATAIKFSRAIPALMRGVSSLRLPHLQYETFFSNTIYRNLFQRVVDYSKDYHIIENVVLDPSHTEAVACLRFPSSYAEEKHVVHPIFLDAVLHVAGLLANLDAGENEGFICTEVDTINVLTTIDLKATYTVYCSIFHTSNEIIGDSWAFEEGDSPRIVAFMKGVRFRRIPRDLFIRKLAKSAAVPTSPKFPPPVSPLHPIASSGPPRAVEQVASSRFIGGLESTVIRVVADACGIGISTFTLDTELDSLGVDSLMSIEIFGCLQKSFSCELDAGSLSSCKTSRALVQKIASATTTSVASPNIGGLSASRTFTENNALPPSSCEARVRSPYNVKVADVKRIVANVLGVSFADIEDTSDFEFLGLDSLASIEALHMINAELELNLPPDFFQTHSTFNAVEKYLNSNTSLASGGLSRLLGHDTFPCPVHTASSSKNLPLFLIHDGSGLINSYLHLSRMDRAVWGIYNPHFLTSEPWSGLVEMAETYCNKISQMTNGPVLLGGWSLGGVLAYETALQLSKIGISVKGIILIDAPQLKNFEPMPVDVFRAVPKEGDSTIRRLVHIQFTMSAEMLKAYNPYGTGGECPALVYLRSKDAFIPPGIDNANVPHWLSDKRTRTCGWDDLTGREVRILDIPGNHFQAFHSENILAFSLLSLITVVFYRLWLHPLNSFPGPRLAAVTYWYQAYYDTWKNGMLTRHIVELHKVYGPVVRVAPNELHFNSVESYFAIYPLHSGFTKDPLFYTSIGIDNSTFATGDIKRHKRQQDALNPFFSRRDILKLQAVVQGKVDLLIEQMRSYDGKPVNLFRAFRALTMDVVTAYCYAHSFGGLTTPNFDHPILRAMEGAIPFITATKFFPVLHLIPEWLGVIMNPDLGGVVQMKAFLAAQIDAIIAHPDCLTNAEHETIYHHLITRDSVGKRGVLSRKDLVDEAFSLLVAGTDTSSNAMTIGFFHVLFNKQAREKLLLELRDAWPEKDSPFSYEMAEKLPYLTGVIKECLRLSTGIPMALPRVVTETTVIDGICVPAGTVVGVGAPFVLNNPALFPNPSEFKPERWTQANLDKYLVSFSKGPRSCLGVNLAWCELYLTFAHLMRKFDMQLFETTEEDMAFRDHSLPVWTTRPLRAIVAEREE